MILKWEVWDYMRSYILRIRYILLFFLFGCSVIEAAPVTYIVVTSEVHDFAQASNLQPTRIPDPNSLIRDAGQLVHFGYFENAINIYNDVLDQPLELKFQDSRADAAFALGQLGIQTGEYVITRTALTLFINEFPEDARIAKAYYLRGQASSEMELWKLGISDFEQYLALGSNLLASFVWERIADLRLELNEREKALELYQLALQHHRSLIPQLILREKLARIHWDAAEYIQAIDQYEAILSVARNAPYRAEMEYNAALATLESGQTGLGIERMRKITIEYPETDHAYLALVTLNQHGVEIPKEEHALISYRTGDYADALNVLEEITSGSEISAENYLMMGRSQRALGDFQTAQLTFQIMAAVYPNSPLVGEALLEQGRTYFLSGNIDAAISRYLSIANDYPHLETAASEALWRAGYLYGTKGEADASLRTFMNLHELYPNSEQTESGLALAAAAAVKSKDLETASRIYSLLTEASNPELRSEAWLWLGAHPNLSTLNQDLALSLAASFSPDSYFAARSADIASGRKPFTAPNSYVFTFNEELDRKEAENWIREKWNIQQTSELWLLSETLSNDLRLLRGMELWELGEFSKAQNEILELVNSYSADPLKSYQLAVFLSDQGIYYPSLVAAAHLIRHAGVATLDAPAYIARLRYPIYFLEPLLASTNPREIDPLLLFALIRQESLFNTYATAAAGEKGLTQVIPSTGDYIAGRLAWPNYSHSDLFRPYVSIEFGAFYLAEQLMRFDKNHLTALAGYNAGPGRAADWLALAGDDPEIFVTTITIDSTRKYVQNIYAQYNIYRSLYGVN